MARADELTDEQWTALAPLIPEGTPRPNGGGKPKKYSNRAILNGILWVLRTGGTWNALPKRFPPGATCFRRFSRWNRTGVMRKVLETLAHDLETSGQIDLVRCFSDGTFVVARKDQPTWERPDAAAVRGSWVLQTLMVFHSPCTRLLLEYLQSPLASLPSLRPSVWDTPDVLSGIAPVRMIRSIRETHGAAI